MKSFKVLPEFAKRIVKGKHASHDGVRWCTDSVPSRSSPNCVTSESCETHTTGQERDL